MMSNEDEEEEKNTSVTPETALAYLDPNYWLITSLILAIIFYFR